MFFSIINYLQKFEIKFEVSLFEANFDSFEVCDLNWIINCHFEVVSYPLKSAESIGPFRHSLAPESRSWKQYMQYPNILTKFEKEKSLVVLISQCL